MGGPYGGIPRVFGGGPIGVKRSLKGKKKGERVERADRGLL